MKLRKAFVPVGAAVLALSSASCFETSSGEFLGSRTPAARVARNDPAKTTEVGSSSAFGEHTTAGVAPHDEPRRDPPASIPDSVSEERGRTLRYVPTRCPNVGFADVKRLESARALTANGPALADRLRGWLDQHTSFAETSKGIHDALAQKGIDWRNHVFEASACSEGTSIRLVVVGGDFESPIVMDALRGWAERSGRPDAILVRDGRPFVHIGAYYVGAVGRGIVAAATDVQTLQNAQPGEPGLLARGGDASTWVLARSDRPWGGLVTARVLPFGDDAFVVDTVVDRIDRPYRPDQDRQLLQQHIDETVSRLRATPGSSLADAVARTDVSFLGTTARMRTVVPESALSAAIARAASSTQTDWLALRPGTPLPSIGGGPGANSGPDRASPAPEPPSPAVPTSAPPGAGEGNNPPVGRPQKP